MSDIVKLFPIFDDAAFSFNVGPLRFPYTNIDKDRGAQGCSWRHSVPQCDRGWSRCVFLRPCCTALRSYPYKDLVNLAPPFRLSYCPPSFPLYWFLFLLPLLPGTLGEREGERESQRIDRGKGSADSLLSIQSGIKILNSRTLCIERISRLLLYRVARRFSELFLCHFRSIHHRHRLHSRKLLASAGPLVRTRLVLDITGFGRLFSRKATNG